MTDHSTIGLRPSSLDEPPDYRTFDLHGSHAHAGYALGQADPLFRMQFWWWPPPPNDFAQSCADVVRGLHPHLLDEFDAYADAQRLPTRELWRKCCRVNLKAKVRPPEVGHLEGVGLLDGATEGCSTFVWFTQGVVEDKASAGTTRPADASTSRVIVGRNYDYLPQQVRRQRIRFVPDCCANATIGARGGVPCGRYDGLNQHGLFVSLHVVMTNTPTMDEVQPGVPFHLVARIALELCHTAREAMDLLMRMPHLSSLNYLVADPHDAFVVEADPRRVRVIEREGNMLAATNHFRHPDMRPLQGGRTFENSECRLMFLLNHEGQHEREATRRTVDGSLDYAERVMADRTTPVCGLSGSLTTLWSCVAELTTKRIRYAAGPPCHTRYEEMPQLGL